MGSVDAQIILRQKASGGNPAGPALATLHVCAFTQRNIHFDVFYASDSRVPASALPANVPTKAQIAAELNATFNPQANVNFVPEISATLSNCYGAFATDGGLYANSPNLDWQYCTASSYDADSTTTVYRIFVVNNIVTSPASVGFTPPSENATPYPYSFVNANANLRTFSHEAGRVLQLPTVGKAEPGGPFDLGPWPVEFQTDGLSDPNQKGLMNDNSGTQERWIRQQDWKASNKNASEAPFH